MSDLAGLPNGLPCLPECNSVTHDVQCEFARLERTLWGIAIDAMCESGNRIGNIKETT